MSEAKKVPEEFTNPLMIKAGVAALVESSNTDPEQMVKAIYLAMRKAGKLEQAGLHWGGPFWILEQGKPKPPSKLAIWAEELFIKLSGIKR